MRKIPLILAVSFLFGVGSAQNLETLKRESAQDIIKSATGDAIKKLKSEERQKVIQEAVKVLEQTKEILNLLAQNKVNEAKSLLNEVCQKMDTLVEKYKLTKVPVDVSIEEYVGVSNINLAKVLNKRVKFYINKNDFVNARNYLEILRNEVDIRTTYMPLYLYRGAIKLAKKFLDEEKVQATILALQSALGTLEQEVVIIPRPFLEAQLLIETAQKLYKEQPEKAIKLLKQAKRDLELLKYLGYVSDEKEIKEPWEVIEELEKSIKAKASSTPGFFEKLKEKFEKLKRSF